MKNRSLYTETWRALSKSKPMIFLAGPRQAGKTTLAQIISTSYKNHVYYNWDIINHREKLTANPTHFTQLARVDDSKPLIVFDEIHKDKAWKNYLKGVYDEFHTDYQLLISGSGRLDIYQKAGDSLAGRYFLFYLWPFTIAELAGQSLAFKAFINNPLQTNKPSSSINKQWQQLETLSGFPEPFLAKDIHYYRRWSTTYRHQLIREDIRDITGIKSIHDIETLFGLLPSKIASPLSIPSLSKDLKVPYNSIKNWLMHFERFFLIFSIYPWTKRINHAIHKERKIYLWDTPSIKDPAKRFENMVALELWRAITSWNSLGYGHFSLHFIKNKAQQEVDFLIANDNEPFLLIEAKYRDNNPSGTLLKFQKILEVPAIQLTREGDTFKRISGDDKLPLLIVPACQWLPLLP